MFEQFFKKYPDYTIVEKPSKEIIKKYNGFLPKELIQFWTEYRFGIYMNGFLKFVNPDDYQDVFEEAYDNSLDNEIVFAITAFGDFLGWAGTTIINVKFRYGFYNYVGTENMSYTFDENFTDDTYVNNVLSAENFLRTKSKLDDLTFDECFGYFPLLILGGSEKPEYLDKVKIREYILLINQFAGQINY